MSARPGDAFERLGLAALESALAIQEFADKFHAELVARSIPPELLSNPEFQRRVRAAVAADPSLSLAAHMIEIGAAMDAPEFIEPEEGTR